MRTAFLFFAAATLIATAALADEAYYIELGSAPSQHQASQRWETLSTQYKTILQGLDFHPATIIQANREPVFRIQAGPIEDKAEAWKTCRTLFAEDVPCFVLEGSIIRKPAPVTAALPWQSRYRDAGILPWLFSTEAEMRQSLPAGEGKVDVAEAIRVPVSEDTASSPSSQIRPIFETKAPPPLDYQPDAAGWLNIRVFSAEEQAVALWQKVRARVPERAAGLRVRIVKSLAGGQQVSLNVGPFATAQGAMDFCEQGVTATDSALTCQFARSEPVGRAASLLPVMSQHSQKYETRRHVLQTEHAAAKVSADMPLTPLIPTRAYWVQVISAGSQMEAMQEWERLKNAHLDLLSDMRSSISSPLAKGAAYVVRVGPLQTNTEAVNLCISLQGRGVHCRIYNM